MLPAIFINCKSLVTAGELPQGLVNMSQKVLTRKLCPEDIPAVASIHKAAYRVDHFSAHLTNTLLERMYAELCRENPFPMVATDSSGQVLGFVVGNFAKYIGQARKSFLANNYVAIAASALLSPLALLKKISDRLSIFLSRESFTSQARMRLISIAVAPASQHKAVGKLLLEAFEDNLKQEGVVFYGLSVKENNFSAVRFYQKNGFRVERRCNDGSLYYVKSLENQPQEQQLSHNG